MIVIEPGEAGNPAVRALLDESKRLMESQFPSDLTHYLSTEALNAPGLHFFTARIGDTLVGTGALAEQDGYGEVKAMFVSETARGQGIAEAMLRQIEDQARALGLALLRLETGNKLNSAVRLYARHGFEMCEPFGDYEPNVTSLFLEKALT